LKVDIKEEESHTNKTISSVPIISDENKALGVLNIEEYYGVRDALVEQDNNGKVWLFISVDYGLSEIYTKRLGDNFVRFVKTTSQDMPPSEAIGKGIYDYTVVVYHPNKVEICRGSKFKEGSEIIWHQSLS
jgi:hypothetical protein